MGLYRDNGLFILRKIHKQQRNRVLKKIISIFKNSDFKINITTNLTEVGFLDLTYNLENNTYRRYKHNHKKRKDSLETRAVLLIFLLELEIFGVAIQSIHQNSKKWQLLVGTA